jgi:hypothetical protein
VPLSSFERDHELRRVRCPRFRSEFSARDRACASAPDPLIAGSGERLHRLVPHNLEHFAERGRAVLGRVPRASGSVIIERPARCRRRATSPDTGWASGENRLSGVWDVRWEWNDRMGSVGMSFGFARSAPSLRPSNGRRRTVRMRRSATRAPSESAEPS